MLAGVVLLGLVVSAALMPRCGRCGAVVLALLSVMWLAVDHSMEGRVLLSVTPSHGVVAADLAGLAGLALAAWELYRSRSTSPR